MDWYKLFRQHILDRGIEYFEDGEVLEVDGGDGCPAPRMNSTPLQCTRKELS